MNVEQQQAVHFSSALMSQFNPSRIPQHIAITPDGNRRWAKQRSQDHKEGHNAGANTLLDIVKAAKELGIKFLTVYSFSTENWSRCSDEINVLMTIYANYLQHNCLEMVNNGIRLETIGNLDQLPLYLQEAIAETKEKTVQCEQITLILAFNYGSRDEICRSLKKLLIDYDKKRLVIEEISEKTISAYLDTNLWPDPDLCIRTSGEYRMSNFLLWQTSYSEMYVSPVFWPDFTPNHLLEAVISYQNRERRWGGK